MTIATLVFLIQNQKILLTYKKRGFGKGKWNGPGGKVEKEESLEECAVREVKEEISIFISKLEKVAILTFYDANQYAWTVHVYTSREFNGDPIETNEVRPEWFSQSQIPYDSMWEDDQYWLPQVLSGEKLRGSFYYSKGLEKLENYNIEKF